MKIKSLEMFGFKSFGDRTVLRFDRQICGVVGPNGCGKSNIVDSIRWVMGEQSAKGLRGNEMSDVIFNGTSNRKKASFAEVSLTFDNSDKLASAPYTDCAEIMITRRLYRSGESEYLINKVPVRLKDITDLFLGTGSSARAYSIVAQGKVDQIVLAKPEDRRFLLEEAAGVAKYKARKQAAERKMDATRQNLERVHDIIRELERNSKYLERQVDRAEQFRKLQTELRTLDEQIVAFKVTKLDRDAQSNEALRTQAQDRFEKTSTDFSQMESKIEELRLSALHFEKVSTSDYERLIQMKEEYSRLDKEIELSSQRVQILHHQIAEREKDLERIRTKAQAHDQTIQQVFIEREQLRQKCAEKKAEIDAKRLELEALDSQIKTLETKGAEIEAMIDQKQTEAAREAQKREMLVSERVNLELYRAEVEQNSEELLTTEKTLEESLESVTQQHEILLSAKTEDEKQLNEALAQEGVLEGRVSELQKARMELQDKVAAAEAHMKALRALEEEEIGYEKGALEKKKQTGLQLLMEQVKFQSGYEKVEEAFFAAFGQIFTEEPQISEPWGARFSFLNSQNLGSSAPISRSLLSLTQGDVSGVLADLMSQIEVVDRIEDAQTKGLRIDMAGRFAMPLSAQVELRSLGDTEKEQTPFGRQAELNRYSQDRESLRSLLSENEASLEASKLEIRDRKARIEALRKNLNEHSKGEIETRAQMARLSSQREALTDKKAELEAEMRDLDAKISSLATEIQALSVKGEDLEGARRDLALLAEEIARLKTQKADLDHVWIEERIAFGALQEKLDRLEQQSIHVEMTKSEYDHNQGIFQSDIENWRSEIERENARVVENKAKQETHQSGLRGLEIDLAQNREELNKIRSELEQLEVARKETQVSKDEAQKTLQHLELEHQRLKYEVEELAQLVEVRYHLSLQEVLAQVSPEALERLEDSVVLGALEVEARELREKVEGFGEVNLLALTEFEEIKQRLEFMHRQQEDLLKTLDSLQSIIDRINKITEFRFRETFKAINHNFQILFPKLFGGGRAFMTLTNEQDLLETGVEIFAEPPGKKVQAMSLLSGGEKAMTSISLLFALFAYRPASFCILDEVDAPLDEVNTTRYNAIIKEMANLSQFIVITHNKRTMEVAETLFGVTMQEPGVSQIVGVELQEARAFVTSDQQKSLA